MLFQGTQVAYCYPFQYIQLIVGLFIFYLIFTLAYNINICLSLLYFHVYFFSVLGGDQ